MGGEEEELDVRLGDASLAAPFTAKSPSIACVADLLRQGRASLARAQQQAQQGIAYALSNLLYHFVLVRRWGVGCWGDDGLGAYGGNVFAVREGTFV